MIFIHIVDGLSQVAVLCVQIHVDDRQYGNQWQLASDSSCGLEHLKYISLVPNVRERRLYGLTRSYAVLLGQGRVYSSTA